MSLELSRQARVLLTVTTARGRFAEEVPLPPNAVPPAAGKLSFAVAGSSLVVGFGLGLARSAGEPLACTHHATICRVSSAGVPRCSEPLLLARAERCSDPGGLATATPAIERLDVGTFSVGGRKLSPRVERIVALAKSTAPGTELDRAEFSKLEGVTGMGIVLRPPREEHWLGLVSSRGRYFSRGPVARARREGDVGYGRHQVVGPMTLYRWSSGSGIIDPPDSSYAACEHHFVACVADDGRPSCSEVVTVARAKRCGPDVQAELPDEVPPARPLPDGRSFVMAGRVYVLGDSDRDVVRPAP
jgi:hypothetical protein